VQQSELQKLRVRIAAASKDPKNNTISMWGDVVAKARFLYCVKCKHYVEITRFKEDLGASSKGGVCD